MPMNWMNWWLTSSQTRGGSRRPEGGESPPFGGEPREAALRRSLARFDEAARADAASIDPEVIWRRVEAGMDRCSGPAAADPVGPIGQSILRRRTAWKGTPAGRSA